MKNVFGFIVIILSGCIGFASLQTGPYLVKKIGTSICQMTPGFVQMRTTPGRNEMTRVWGYRTNVNEDQLSSLIRLVIKNPMKQVSGNIPGFNPSKNTLTKISVGIFTPPNSVLETEIYERSFNIHGRVGDGYLELMKLVDENCKF